MHSLFASDRFCLTVCLIGIPCKGSTRGLPDLDDVLTAIRKVLLFYLDRHELMNADAILGVRFAQGQPTNFTIIMISIKEVYINLATSEIFALNDNSPQNDFFFKFSSLFLRQKSKK